MKTQNLKKIISLILIVGLLFSFGYIGFTMAFANEEILTRFIGFTSPKNIELSSLNALLLRISGVWSMVSAILLAVGIAKSIGVFEKGISFLLWGLLLGLFALMFYGLPVRLASNHTLSATLFAYLVLVFWLFRYLKSPTPVSSWLENLQYLPIYGLLFFTMGQPGYNKIFNSQLVMGNYEKMFADSLLSQMPGGIPPFIYFLGICELIVPMILIINSSC